MDILRTCAKKAVLTAARETGNGFAGGQKRGVDQLWRLDRENRRTRETTG
jgi:hypothetical protein